MLFLNEFGAPKRGNRSVESFPYAGGERRGLGGLASLPVEKKRRGENEALGSRGGAGRCH